MSIITAIVIRNRMIHFIQGHYRGIMNLLSRRFEDVPFYRLFERYVDGGYIVIDYDRKVIINSQECFLLNEVVLDDFRMIL